MSITDVSTQAGPQAGSQAGSQSGSQAGSQAGSQSGSQSGSQAGSGSQVDRQVGRVVVAGVDTHQLTHHVVVLDTTGRRLGDRGFEASSAGYAQAVDWMAGFGTIEAVGVESSGSYGAGLTLRLLTAGIEVIEVSRPEKATRAQHGKSDPVDAESAARQVLAGTATGRPKVKTGIIEAIRAIKVPRDAAVRDRTRGYSQLRDLVTTAPVELREQLLTLTGKQRVAVVAGYRPDPTRLADPTQATKLALRTLARRIRALDAEIDAADAVLADLVAQAVPTVLGLPRVGVQSAARLAITAGQNIDRMRSEATFAKLTGVAPIPASSGKSTRMRLNRGGDRQANSALYMIAIGRLQSHQPTLAYLARRQHHNLSKRDLIRCLKRYIAREIYTALKHDLLTT
jgi:transposase